jgi:hypothetical protein
MMSSKMGGLETLKKYQKYYHDYNTVQIRYVFVKYLHLENLCNMILSYTCELFIKCSNQYAVIAKLIDN